MVTHRNTLRIPKKRHATDGDIVMAQCKCLTLCQTGLSHP